MSADNRTVEAKRLSQPLVAAPMPEYEFQRADETERPAFEQKSDDQHERKLDLSGVVFNFS
ncbi:MAG: hypothetical protein J0H84_19995 [Rhizobiales bacterium]|nr:hypothetical protein [Hyphomicrobiales bacterium]